MEYIDLVCVKIPGCRRPHLFYAPAFSSRIEKGVEVEVMTRFGSETGTVVDKMSVGKDSDDLRFIVVAAGAQRPLGPVLSVITREAFEYDNPMIIEPAPTTPGGE